MSGSGKYIQRIHMPEGGFRHEHITEVEYRYGASERIEHVSTAVMALLIDDYAWDVEVVAGNRSLKVRTFHPYGRPAYLRATADGHPTDDLLDLPTY